ncbi:phenylalanine--tRNA ligase subunit beta [Mycoplasma leonicaptivi]|uniref:phenylalanine--tRNA ligase subunit beta n=1 Tax=Mycoplasma leonicaptivi TaxID=36742 RepID=UPI000482BEEB|nr:phenylalanine--tRNA ligase subunit beta [Mycoplasma leonicaptivi]
MILSLKHLNKYLPKIKLDSKEVEIALNELGFEVEQSKPFSDVKGLIFAKVLKVYPNPNSDRLDVVELQTKDGQIIIQTTNRILKENNLIICFAVGSSKDGQIFKEIKLKGLPSQGMMASWSEIGYNWEYLTDKDEILVLPNDFASLEDDPMDLLNVNDTIIEISTTANRNDANSYYYIAKELSAYFKTDFKDGLSEIKPHFESDFYVDTIKSSNVESLSFTQIKGKFSTSIYHKTLLAKHDINSKFDWAVNLTNLALIETGAPAHVYDASKLSKNMSANEIKDKITILGNKEIEVENVLAITSNNKPVSLACVMGLENSKADTDTQDYLFEIGIFNPKSVRYGAKAIKLNSNSSSQGSRIISNEVAELGMKYIRNYAKNCQISQVINPVKNKDKKKIIFDTQKLSKYSGQNNVDIFNTAIKQLESIGFEFKKDCVLVPNYRYDVNLFEDVIEEIFRFYSYSNFKPQKINSTTLKTQRRNINKNVLKYMGYTEVRTYSLVSKDKNKFNPFNFEKEINLMTFVSKERETIRNSIIISLQEIVDYNFKRKINTINIFEHGMINQEKFVYGFASTTKSFNELKQDIINFAKMDLNFVKFDDNEMIHPNESAKIMFNNEMIGWIGKLHPKYDDYNVLYAELELKDISRSFKYQPVDFSPLKTIDLTFTLKNNEYIGETISKIKAVSNDIFEIKQIDDYKFNDSHNVTIRITAKEDVIELINKKFNS